MSETEAQTNASEARPAKSSSNQPVSDFVRDHPLLVVAGGIAIGAIAASLLPRGTGRKLARHAVGLAEIAGTAGALLGSRVRDGAEAAGSGLREQGDVVAARLGRLGESASGRIGQLSGAASAGTDKLIDSVEGAASIVVKKAAELRSRVRH